MARRTVERRVWHRQRVRPRGWRRGAGDETAPGSLPATPSLPPVPSLPAAPSLPGEPFGAGDETAPGSRCGSCPHPAPCFSAGRETQDVKCSGLRVRFSQDARAGSATIRARIREIFAPTGREAQARNGLRVLASRSLIRISPETAAHGRAASCWQLGRRGRMQLLALCPLSPAPMQDPHRARGPWCGSCLAKKRENFVG